MIEYILLGFLMYGEMTGYDLKQYMGQSTSNFYDASYGSIYPALKRLESAGYVVVREEPSGNRVRNVYCLQESGRLRFLEWMESPMGVSKNSTEPLIRVFFLQFMDVNKARTLIQGYMGELKAEIEHLETIEPKVTAMANPYQLSTLTYGKEHYRHQIQWCEYIISLLDASGERSV